MKKIELGFEPKISPIEAAGGEAELMEGARGKETVDNEPVPNSSPATVDPRDIISSDDEIDYSIKPAFYDPNLDEKDELWVHRQRKGRSSDAVLSCPACFTTLCLDCQRHEQYVTQYRAMFVRNCNVRTDQILKQERRKQKKSRSRGHVQFGESQDDTENDEVYRPVCCSVCSTEVGVFDADEVYHFFNVIPSNS